MPASLISDMNSHGGGLEDQQAFEDLARELTRLGITPPEDGSQTQNCSGYEDAKMKKSANMTECVPVPSSEHVAEIVGRQGCKIKALRAKTNTYIKTPVRGEEPVFVVTGRREDVCLAKREILSAAEHFSQIRASRRNNSSSSTGSMAPGPPSPTTPGQVTIQVRVPYRVVGLVVGPKGATIKRIQQQTHTYIVTPSRDKEPVFEVTGLPENVETAKKEIESHIAMRTGGIVDANGVNNKDADNDFLTNGVDCGYPDVNSDLIANVFKPPSSNSAFTTYSALNSNNLLSHHTSQDSNIFTFPTINGSSKIADYSSLNNHCSGFTANGFGLYDHDEGIATSPSFDPTTATTNSLWPDLGEVAPNAFSVFTSSNSLPRRNSSSISSANMQRLSPTLTDSTNSTEHTSVRRIRSDPLSGGLSAMQAFAPLPGQNGNYVTSGTSLSSSSSTSSSPTDSTGSWSNRRRCIVCAENDIVAAFVPCGHNLFCMECANNLIHQKPDTDRRCPVCHQTISQAIRIFS